MKAKTESTAEKFHGWKAAQQGRVGYLVLWLLGAPLPLLFLLWVFFGDNLMAPG